jgi:hypothetical protein
VSNTTGASLNGTGFSDNGIADVLRQQIAEPRKQPTFKPKPCEACGQTIENPGSGRTKYHEGCKPTGKRASASNGTQQSEQAAEAGKKAEKATAAPKRKRRAPARRAAAKAATPASTTLADRLSADCDQELQRLDGELERLEKGVEAMRDEQAKLQAELEKGIEAMREEQAKVQAERAEVERVQKALA